MPEDKKPFMPSGLLGWLDVAVKAGAIFAGGFAIFQYLDARQDARVEQTLSYVSAFGDGTTPVGQARSSITAELWANRKQMTVLDDLMSRLPPDEAARLRRRFVDKLVYGADGNGGLRDDLHAVIAFFDDLVTCIDQGLCDRASAAAFFGEYGTEFWRNFAQFIEDRRTLVSDYGKGIKTSTQWAEEGS